MAQSLSEIMEFDHVIEVHADGSITDAPTNLYAPEFHGEDERLEGREPWSLFSIGYTGQYASAHSGVMHNSEFIGGGLERDIRATPGYYVSVVCYWEPNDDDIDAMAFTDDPSDRSESVIEGWGVAFLPSPESD